jgi:cell wall-associated NlpC family hydrolase
VRERTWRYMALALCGALVSTIGLTASSPASAEPDIATVQKRVDALYEEAEQAQERLHDLNIELARLERDLGSLTSDRERQRARLAAARANAQDAIVSQYQGYGTGAVGQVVLSDDPAAFLSGLSTMAAYRSVQAELFDIYRTEVKALSIRTRATHDRTEEISRLRARAAAEQSTIGSRVDQAETLLERLKAEEREELLSRGSTRLPSGVETSGRAAAAVRYAMAQVGKQYVYGAAGPSTFDCSGLMLAAWAQAGVSLPRSSQAQFGAGPRIAVGDLRPGDLVFYYSGLSHVGMYIGNGLIVDASNPRTDVRVTTLYSMPYVGAVRPG